MTRAQKIAACIKKNSEEYKNGIIDYKLYTVTLNYINDAVMTGKEKDLDGVMTVLGVDKDGK